MSCCRIKFLTQDPTFKKTVLDVLNSPTSWGIKMKEWNTRVKTPPDIIMGISPTRSHHSIIRGKKVYFSATYIDKDPPVVLFDPYNYKYGVKKSGLSVSQYREYVINHETGHALGLDHLRCNPGEICPVMYQMTKGIPRNSTPNSRVTQRDQQTPCRRSKTKSRSSSSRSSTFCINRANKKKNHRLNKTH